MLVVKAGESRWCDSNRYVYDRIQEMFGKDAASRFVLMCTFADGAPPLAVETLKPYVKFQHFFPFNNSALYVPSDKGTVQTKNFWKMGTESVDNFLDFVVREYARPLSLTRSVEVLDLRESLYTSIASAQNRISASFAQLEATSRLIGQIKKHRKDIDANGTFTYTENEEKVTRKPLGNVYQMCQKCQETCCQICVWPAGAVMSQCTFFNNGRNCPKCRGGCPKEDHVRADYAIIRKMVPVQREYTHMKEALQVGQQGLSTAEALLRQKRDEMHHEAKLMLCDMQTVKESLATLDDIAMKPRVFTDADYFKEMIKHEEESRQPGYEGRVAGLRLLAERADTIAKLSTAKNIEDLFPQYKEIIDEVIDKDERQRGKCPLM